MSYAMALTEQWQRDADRVGVVVNFAALEAELEEAAAAQRAARTIGESEALAKRPYLIRKQIADARAETDCRWRKLRKLKEAAILDVDAILAWNAPRAA